MLADTLRHTELASVVGLLRSAGIRLGDGYSAWSDNQAASDAETAVKVVNTVTPETPGLALGAGGEWLSAWNVDDKVQIWRSTDHCASWTIYQTLT